MQCVYVYGGAGVFVAPSDYEWNSPESGHYHRFILFMRQSIDAPLQDAARAELQRFGFTELEMYEGKPLFVEALNDPKMQAFQKHYEGALEEGVSLVWYP